MGLTPDMLCRVNSPVYELMIVRFSMSCVFMRGRRYALDGEKRSTLGRGHALLLVHLCLKEIDLRRHAPDVGSIGELRAQMVIRNTFRPISATRQIQK